MPAASILGDKAQCPADAHGCPSCAHPTIGPAVAGSPTVFVNGKPLLRLNDPGVHSSCCGPNMWKVAQGSSTVSANGLPVARLGDATKHCGGMGKLVEGSGDVFVGGSPTSAVSKLLSLLQQVADGIAAVVKKVAAALDPKKAAEELLDKGLCALERWNDDDKAHFKKYFGTDSEEARQEIIDRTKKAKAVLKGAKLKQSDGDCDEAYACVYADDKNHTIYLGEAYESAPLKGENSKAGTLIHEVSHFDDVGGTEDHAYGVDDAKTLAEKNSTKALNNADNYEYYFETLK